jgi:ATP-dependent RNA helicase DeaD
MEDETNNDLSGFSGLGLRDELLRSLNSLGYEEPTPIQREAIPHLLAGHDLLGQAATGTGKTAAFALPVLQRIEPKDGTSGPLALVLVPTRELAMQVSEAMYKYGHELGAKVVPIYGGQHIGRQLDALRRGVHVVVATPGRALDHIKRGTLPLGDVQVVVLDEADEMLDMGFAEDLEAILGETPKTRQTVLFSATLPPRIDAIARRHQRNPVRVQIGMGKADQDSSPLVRQSAFIVPRSHKPAALGRILDIESPTAAIVFCRTRTEVDQLAETLNGRGYRAEALHGGLSQEQRDRVMGRLRTGTADLLIATDVAARGLDIDVLTHVVNYEVPSAPETYVHRIGRVGRAGREGVAITLAEPREQRLLSNIERLTKQKISIEKIPTVADLRARQMDLTLEMLRDAMGADDLDRFRYVVNTLAAEYDIADIALAAVKLAHEASGNTVDEIEIPDVTAKPAYERAGPKRFEKGPEQRPWEKRPDKPAWGDKPRAEKPAWADKPRDDRPRDDKPRDDKPREDRTRFVRGRDGGGGETVRIYVGLGRHAGVRPQDLVGAIANETSLSGKDIGAIKVADKHSVVEVPAHAIDEVLGALAQTTIKGKRATVRRYSE